MGRGLRTQLAPITPLNARTTFLDLRQVRREFVEPPARAIRPAVKVVRQLRRIHTERRAYEPKIEGSQRGRLVVGCLANLKVQRPEGRYPVLEEVRVPVVRLAKPFREPREVDEFQVPSAATRCCPVYPDSKDASMYIAATRRPPEASPSMAKRNS